MASISTWSTTAASNNQASPDGAPEGWLPSEVNAWGRETMASIRAWYEDAEWIEYGHTLAFVSATQFTTAAGDGDTTDVYHVGRRVRAVVTAGTIYGTVTASSGAGPTTVTVDWDGSSALDSGLSAASVGIVSADSLSIDALAVDRLVAVAGIESTTLQLFQQASAPTGWTKEVTHDDKALRVVTGAFQNGGATSFTSVFDNAVQTDNFTLLTTHMPAHTHLSPYVFLTHKDGEGGTVNSMIGGFTTATSAAGGGTGHAHDITATMDLQYVDLIIASKN